MRLGAVFIAVCIVVVAASAGATVYLGFGFSGTEAIIVALAAMTALGLYYTFSNRLGVRSAVGSQLSELSRSNFELARQVNEISRRLSGVEGRVESAQQRARAAVDPLAVEISELGTLVRQLAETVATYEARFDELAKAAATAPAIAAPPPAALVPAAPVPAAPVPAPPAVEPLPALVEDIVQAMSPTPIAPVAAVPAPPPEPKPQGEPVIAAAVGATTTAHEERLAVILQRHRCQSHRPLSAADRDAAAAQGALLRGDDAAAHRDGTLPARGRLRAAWPNRAGLMPKIDNLCCSAACRWCGACC